MSDPIGNGNTAPALTSVTALLCVWSAFTLLVRVWIKLRKRDSWGTDDSFISLAFLFVLANVIAICLAVNHGYGSSWQDLSVNRTSTVNKALYASQIFYVASIGCTRISTGLFTSRFLTRDAMYTKLAHIISGLFGFWAIASLVVIAVRRPLLGPWRTRDGSERLYIRWLAIEIVGCVLKLAAFAFSAHLVWTLQMSIKKRAQVTAILASRLAVFPVIVLRLWKLSPSQNTNTVVPNLWADIYTEIALEDVFIFASVTCLKPLFRPFHDGYFISTVRTGHTIAHTSKAADSRSETYLMLSTPGSITGSKDGTIIQSHLREGARHNSITTQTMRVDRARHQTSCAPTDEPRTGPDSHDIRISKTVEIRHDRKH